MLSSTNFKPCSLVNHLPSWTFATTVRFFFFNFSLCLSNAKFLVINKILTWKSALLGLRLYVYFVLWLNYRLYIYIYTMYVDIFLVQALLMTQNSWFGEMGWCWVVLHTICETRVVWYVCVPSCHESSGKMVWEVQYIHDTHTRWYIGFVWWVKKFKNFKARTLEWWSNEQ